MAKQRYFTLIRGDSIVPAPSSRNIPSQEFSELLSGKELLEVVKMDAEDYKKQIAHECEKIKEESYKDGFKEGFEAWSQMIGFLEKEITRVREEMQKSIMPIAIKAAKKIVGGEISQRPDAVVDMVMSTAKVVSQHKKVAIYVSRSDYQVVESNKARLRQLFEEIESLSIRERDDLVQGDCIIETEVGIINARLVDRWKTLEAALKSMQSAIQGAMQSSPALSKSSQVPTAAGGSSATESTVITDPLSKTGGKE